MISMKSIRGFSLLEVMIVVGLLAGLSLVAMNISKQSNKSSAKYQLDTEISLITNEINGILSDPKSCLATVKLATLDHVQQYSNTTGAYTSKYLTNSVNGNGKAKILSYALDLGPGAETPLLKIVFENKEILKNSDSSNPTISKIIKLEITPNGAAAVADITTCRSVSTATDTMWNRVSGTSIIHYDSGNVGIGTATPEAKLDVDGEIRAGSTGVLENGACSTEGAFAYDKVAHKPVFCNNDSPTKHWTAMNGSNGEVLSIYGTHSGASVGTWNVSTITSNTLLTPPPSTSLITIQKAGNYFAVSTSYICVAGSANYMQSFIVHNGTYVANSVIRAFECGSTSATVGLKLAVGDTIEAQCNHNQGFDILCTFTLTKL